MEDTPKENIIRLRQGDIEIDVALPWDTFDKTGRLLLRKGCTVASSRQLLTLLEKGVYRQSRTEDAQKKSPPLPQGPSVNPFAAVDDVVNRSRSVLCSIAEGRAEDAGQRIMTLCGEIQELAGAAPDALLGAMHLGQDAFYPIAHSVYCALLTELIARRLQYETERRRTLIAAALSSNVGMLDLQEKLWKHQGPLPAGAWDDIKQHPQRGVALLKAAGIADDEWLEIVEHHHEKGDGSGYNLGLSVNEINRGAKIISVADRYHAFISDRAQRAGFTSTESLRKLFLQKEGLDEECIHAFIKGIGVYPPGTWVRLFNGEIGVVLRRGDDGASPQMASVVSPHGASYPRHFVRDCRDTEYAIKEMTAPPSIPVTNLRELWDIKKSLSNG